MHIHGYGAYDPLVTLRVELLSTFVKAVASSHLQLSLEATWPKLVSRLRDGHRWKRVTGPASACIATLHDIGWQADSMKQWVDPAGHTWFLDYKDPCLPAQIVDVVRQSITNRTWSLQASMHHHAKGIDGGIDLSSGLKLLRLFNKTNKPKHYYWCDAIMQESIGADGQKPFLLG